MDVFTRIRIRQALVLQVRRNPSHVSGILANQIQLPIVVRLTGHHLDMLRNQLQTRPDY